MGDMFSDGFEYISCGIPQEVNAALYCLVLQESVLMLLLKK